MGTDDLTAAEETDLYNGVPPADAVHVYTLDEGRGVTANDRGSGANNGTLGSANIWAFGRVEQPVLSPDGVNDQAVSSAGVFIKEPCTFVWVAKLKSKYMAQVIERDIVVFRVDANNRVELYAPSGGPGITFLVTGGGTVSQLFNILPHTLDEYVIFLATIDSSGVNTAYKNGSLLGSASGAGPISAAAATAYLSSYSAASNYSSDKPLFAGLFESAFTARQALAFSRWLDKIFNLGLGI